MTAARGIVQLIPGKEGEITNFSLIGNTRHVTQDTGIHKRLFWSELLHVKFANRYDSPVNSTYIHLPADYAHVLMKKYDYLVVRASCRIRPR